MFDNIIYSLRHVEQNLLSEICRRWDRFKLFDIIYTQIYRSGMIRCYIYSLRYVESGKVLDV